MKIGILVIATNKYIKFVGPLWESTKKFFMKGHNINMFVFTDSTIVPQGTIHIFQEHMPWPGPTLKRYHIFTNNESKIKDMDYLYYCDADMRFENTVGDEILSDLVATQHPGFWDKPYPFFSQSYERRPESKAYMPPKCGEAYYAGGFNGGLCKNYLNMAWEIRKRVDEDLNNGIIAVWHDESHMNKYMFEHKPTKVLSPSYCYQEEVSLPFIRKLVALKKIHEEIRS